jgi:16S rRNA (adenine1518-N6/adenine1519-N6)-dimethyltransferase
VDENDVVQRTATRAEVHAQRLIHRAVHVFVFNRNGDLYLQKRSRLKDMSPGLWDSSVSGHLDAGEDYEAAAMRELEEEIGISTKAEDLKRIGVMKPSEETGWEHVHVFVMSSKASPNFPAAEIEAMMPFSIAEIQKWIAASPGDFAPAFRLIFQTMHAARAIS